MQASPAVGSTVTCAETGKPFTIATDGSAFNYASNAEGQIFSDEGVDIRERRELLDRSKPFTCYISGDGKSATGWKGNILGAIIASGVYRNNWGARVHTYSVRDVHGAYWHGLNSGPGMCITLRPSKG